MKRLDEKRLCALLGAERGITALDEVDSTNSYAKRESLPCGSLVCTAMQSGGRGRLGKSFASPAGGVYMTVVFSPVQVTSPMLLTVVAAAACARYLSQICAEEIGIKWVNDIFADGKKAVGILCEALCGADGVVDRLICGIGINVNSPPEAFPEEIRGIVGAVHTEKSREEIIAGVYAEILHMLSLPPETVLAEYKKRLFVLGREISYTKNGEKRAGVAFDINSEANLLVRTDGGADVLSAGEITLGSGGFVKNGR